MDCPDPIARFASSRRILVLGSSGSGKTTFSIQLGQLLGIEVIHLDAEFWQPGWIATPQPQWRGVVSTLVQRQAWVMDGTYESSLDLRIPFADSVILIEQSRWTCLWRALKRKLTVDDLRRPDAPAGQKLDLAFLRYIWRYPVVTHPFVLKCLREQGPEKPVIALKGTTEAKGFLEKVKAFSDRSSPVPRSS